MPPPTNTTAATAIVIPGLPYSTTQRVDDNGTTYDVWYSFTPPACVELLGIIAYGDATIYTPRVQVYIGPASAPIVHYNDSGDNDATQVPVVPETEYFIKLRTNVGNPSPANLALSVYAGPNITAPVGSLVISDDTPGYPAMIVNASTGEVSRSRYPFPSGEEGDSLPGGQMLVSDPYDTQTYQLFNAQFDLVTTLPTLGANYYAMVRATPGANVFVIADAGWAPEVPGEGVGPTVGTVGPDGILGATLWMLPALAAQLRCFVADNNLAILYYATWWNSEVRRWDLEGDVGLAPLVATVTDHGALDMLMLADGSLVVSYFGSSGATGHLMCKRYNAAGATLNTYELGWDHGSLVPRLGYSGTAGIFWVYTHPPATYGPLGRYGVLYEIRASDGVRLTTLTVPEYVAGAYEPGITSADPVPFGISPSCPIFPLYVTFEACGNGGNGGNGGGPRPGACPVTFPLG